MGGYHGPAFDANRGVTQGDIVSPTIFNVVVDAIIRYWLLIVSDEGYGAFEGLGDRIRKLQALFYADDGLLASRSSEFLQRAFDCLIGLFERVGLKTNTSKTKAMTCFPGHISGSMSSRAYKRRMQGEGESPRARKRRRVQCPACGIDISAGSLQQHMQRQHGLHGVIQQDDTVPQQPAVYSISFPRTIDLVQCPVKGCPGTATSRSNLHRHFMHRHVFDTIIIPEEGSAPLPRCELCDMFIPYKALNRGHQRSAYCREGADRKRQRHANEDIRRASEVVFTARGTPLESVQTFVYLGRPLSCFDNDWPALYRNVKKARQRWAMIAPVLAREGAKPRVSGMFYKAVVQSVLLFGSETWNLNSTMLKTLQGFHHRIARRLSRRMPRFLPEEDKWEYPPIEEALSIAGLYPIEIYISRRQNTVADYIACRPILDLCIKAERLSGSHTRQWWWEQLGRLG